MHSIIGVFRKQPEPTEIEVVGARRTPFSDLYNDLLRAPWWIDLLCLIALFLLLNLLFGLGYLAIGGIAGARPGSLADHFFFSVQTMGTIGYGVMHPLSATAEALVTCEVIVGVSLLRWRAACSSPSSACHGRACSSPSRRRSRRSTEFRC